MFDNSNRYAPISRLATYVDIIFVISYNTIISDIIDNIEAKPSLLHINNNNAITAIINVIIPSPCINDAFAANPRKDTDAHGKNTDIIATIVAIIPTLLILSLVLNNCFVIFSSYYNSSEVIYAVSYGVTT